MKSQTIYFIIIMTVVIFISSFVSAGIGEWFGKIFGKEPKLAPFNVSVQVGNNIPQIIFVSSIGIVQPLQDTFVSVSFNFTAFDQDGETNLNDNTAQARFNYTGEALRENLTCIPIVGESTSTTQNYSCTIDMWYFDINGDWTINATIQDNNGAKTENSTTTFTYNSLSGNDFSPKGLQWQTLAVADKNITATEPMSINNTGNNAYGTISITAINLLGQEDTTKTIFAGNFTVDIDTGGSPPAECNGAIPQNNTAVTVPSATLPRGNHSINDESTGKEKLYFCITAINEDLSPQIYSTLNSSSWNLALT